MKCAIVELQSKLGTVSILDLEKRLAALEEKPIEAVSSRVTFAPREETQPPKCGIATLLERIRVLEWKAQLLEPTSTLHSSSSSGPTDLPGRMLENEPKIQPPESHSSAYQDKIPR